MIEHGHATAAELPGALFAIEPENFWELMARRSRLELVLGVRCDVVADTPEVSYVVASDSVLLGELLNGVTTLGGTAKHRKESMSDHTNDYAIPHPEYLKQSLVWSPGQAPQEEVLERATRVYKEFATSHSDKAIVGIGSTKSNPVVEIILANAFNCEPFVSQDDVKTPQDRHVPFFVRYRDNDPHPASCAGGVSLSKSMPSNEPGIYYEDENGQWQLAPANNKEDCAFLCYVHRESLGRLEMVMGGFSGRATRLLASSLATQAQEFWPPIYSEQGIQASIYIVKFSMTNPNSKKNVDILRTDLTANTKVIPVSRDSIRRAFER